MENYKVYKHTFPNSKIYIGITKRDVVDRWQNGKGYCNNERMFEDINKFGWDNIKHEILYENLSKDEATKLELSLILEYKSNCKKYGYNNYPGKSKCLSNKTKFQTEVNQYSLDGTFIRKWNSLRDVSKELGFEIAHLYGSCIGQCNTIGGYIWRFAKDMPNMELNEEEKFNLAESAKRKGFVVYQYTLDGEFIRKWTSAHDVHKELGIAHVGDCCQYLRKSAGGFIWRYAEDVEEKLLTKLYIKKIVSGTINPATGEAWKIDDVPARWREAVREALENNTIKPRDGEMVEE